MAKILATYNFDRPGRSKYDWDSWLDGRCWELTQGEDFTCKPVSFANSAKDWAKKMGRKLNLHVTETAVILQLQPAPAAKTTNGNGNGHSRDTIKVGAAYPVGPRPTGYDE